MIRVPSLLLSMVLSALTVSVSLAPARAEQRTVIFAPGGIALSGYDAVAYFTEGRPVRGTAHNAIMWRGATWYFASPETLMSFEMNPQAYAPQFGGYCAYAVAEGRTASAAPDAFFVYKGRLYMMHEAAMVKDMQSRLPDIVAEAEANWPEALDK